MVLKLNRTGNPIDRNERNNINQNWDNIEKDFNNVVSVVSNEAYNRVVDAAKLIWQEPVNTFADLAITYPNAEEGWTAMAREVVNGVNKVYRYNGTEWKQIQQISADAVNEVDNRLTQKLTDITIIIEPTGTQNDSPNLNAIFENNGRYLIKEGTYWIDEDVRVPKTCEITWEQGAVWRKTPTSRETYYMLNIYDCDDVLINNPCIIGDVTEHQGTGGEWGHGININNSLKVKINNPIINDCWGDGIYTGNRYGVNLTRTTERVIINSPVINNCRRNGISVCNGKYIEINNPIIKNIRGTLPMAGIDVEPEGDVTLPILEYLVINGANTENCGKGIELNLSQLSNRGLYTEIDIINHTDTGSDYALAQFNGADNVKGKITITKPKAILNRSTGIILNNNKKTSPLVELVDPYIYNCNVSNQTSDRRYQSAISLVSERPSSEIQNNPDGNIIIKNIIAIDDRETKKMIYSIYVKNSDINAKSQDISILDIVKSEGLLAWIENGAIISDTYKKLTSSPISFQQEVQRSSIKTDIDNKNTLDTTYFNLFDNYPENTEVTFTILIPRFMRLVPSAASKITTTSAVGKAVQSGNVGNSITVKRIGNLWVVTKIIGDWAEVT